MPTIIDAKNLIKLCLQTASEKFNVDLSKVEIKFSKRGKAAACAGGRRNPFTGEFTNLYLNFNKEAIALDWDGFVKQTISHEVAHLVCYLRPELGKNHDRGWQRVDRMLDGTGERCHNLKLTPGRRTKKYAYVTTGGHNIEVGAIRHNKIQNGAIYRVKGQGGIHKDCEYKRVA